MTRKPRFASARGTRRQPTHGQPKFSRSHPEVPAGSNNERFRLDRETTFEVYFLIAFIPLTFVSILVLAVWAHDEFIPGFFGYVFQKLTWFADVVRQRPSVLVVLVLVALFLWSCPWERWFPSAANGEPPNRHRRGRRIVDRDEAIRTATTKRGRRRRGQR